LSLTSTDLSSHRASRTNGKTSLHEDVLLVAACAAKRMPNLEILELWNATGEGSPACVFRYAHVRGRDGLSRVSLKLQTTWGVTAPDWKVVRRWQEVVDFHGIRAKVRVNNDPSNHLASWAYQLPCYLLVHQLHDINKMDERRYLLTKGSYFGLRRKGFWYPRTAGTEFQVDRRPENEDYPW